MLVPLSYNVRSLLVRRSSTLLTVLGIGATVAVVAGVLALQAGFASLYAEAGQPDVAVFLRPGATDEGQSSFTRDRAQRLIGSLTEAERDENDLPLASMECFLAVRRFRVNGGETNVPLRGVQARTFDIRGDTLRIPEGRRFEPGSDEVILGRGLVGRIRGAELGGEIRINTTLFQVVGIFESDGPFASEIWGDLDSMLDALDRPGPNRVVAKLQPGTSLEALGERLDDDKSVPAKVLSEREYLSAQTQVLSLLLKFLAGFLGVVMGVAAVFTATTTMLAALSARTHEIGILLATGFRPGPIFLSFLFEALVLGLLGGIAGCLMVLPINGIETGTTNFQTFTEVAFRFRVTPSVLATAVVVAVVLGLLGGAWPALRAAMMRPVDALSRR